MTTFRVMQTRKLNRRQFVEIRRKAGEHYLQVRLGPSYHLRVRGNIAIIDGMDGAMQIRLPLKAILEPDGLHKRGIC